MHCSTCKNIPLEPQELEPGLIVASCPSCNGVLVSLMNYRFWADRYTTAGITVESANDDEANESESVHSCPKCSRLMVKYQIGSQTQHKLDLCRACDEAWLDKGEWQLLKRLDLQGKLPKVFTDAWQRNIRKQRQEAALNERYEKLLGEESFFRVKEFRNWLLQQPNKDAIKQYLISHQE
ncbi:TFIIB-type zinc ribbon-containing protein [Cellvibrio mixtus]|uniref:zf-TFIIB domain-containing protein n=1 Tax=Cellvibrio mixtus TaxID=39650 RepID=UPI00069420AE|nr:zf-TFIIB domain-containing protein [Cellvibrio mixtus]